MRANATETTHHSDTSSALASLIPTAAAAGIIQANYNTPEISFYSPSANLIQLEGSSSPETSASTVGSPIVTTSTYNNIEAPTAHHQRSATARLPPARPTLIPKTKYPTFTIPLPLHLRHHHNYRHPERSQIDPYKSLIEPSPAIKGCGGVIKTHNFNLRSGTQRSPHKKTKPCSRHNHVRLENPPAQDLRSDANFYKSQCITLTVQSCRATQKSKQKTNSKTLHKRHVPTNKGHASVQQASEPQHRLALGRKTRQPKQRCEESVSDPLAGHALRVCFCQPDDGGGKPMHADASCKHQHQGTSHAIQRLEEEVAARPVNPSRQKGQTTCRSGTSKAARQMRCNQSIGVGVGLR
jgi:hypothetical protein